MQLEFVEIRTRLDSTVEKLRRWRTLKIVVLVSRQWGQTKLGDAALYQLSIFFAEAISLAQLKKIQASYTLYEFWASI